MLTSMVGLQLVLEGSNYS